MALKLMLLVLLAAVSNIGVTQFISTGMTVVLNDIPYYIPAAPVATVHISPNQLNAGSSAAGLVPLTVVETTSLTFSQSDLETVISNYSASDDVFQTGFLQGRYLKPSSHIFHQVIASSLRVVLYVCVAQSCCATVRCRNFTSGV